MNPSIDFVFYRLPYKSYYNLKKILTRKNKYVSQRPKGWIPYMGWMFNRDRLPALREARGLTQEQFAEKLDTSKQHVSRWETGDLVPTTSTIIKIANIFGIAPSYFFTSTDQQVGG
jgi:DNA-binding XRE family transcriptional regulator